MLIQGSYDSDSGQGPIVPVKVRGLPWRDNPSMVVKGEIDADEPVSAVSRNVVERLELKPYLWEHTWVGGPYRLFYAATLVLESHLPFGGQVVFRNLSVASLESLGGLGDCDVLIGRDICGRGWFLKGGSSFSLEIPAFAEGPEMPFRPQPSEGREIIGGCWPPGSEAPPEA